MSVKLHRCGLTWLKFDGHPCCKVEEALQERVLEPTFPRGRRGSVREHTGQTMLPVIETADGSWVRDESKVLIEQIEAGKYD